MRFQLWGTNACCGLFEIGKFGDTPEYYGQDKFEPMEGRAYFATTTWGQVRAKKKLRAWGFKQAMKWTNGNTGHKVVLWLYNPEMQKKKRKKRTSGQ